MIDIDQLHGEIWYQVAYTMALLEGDKQKSKEVYKELSDKIHEILVSRVELPVILQAERDERIRRLQAGYTGVNVEKAHCQICNKEHTIWVNYNQQGVCIINECRNNQEIFGKWLEKP